MWTQDDHDPTYKISLFYDLQYWRNGTCAKRNNTDVHVCTCIQTRVTLHVTHIFVRGHKIIKTIKFISKYIISIGNDSPYIPKSWLFWGRFGSRYVEAAYDTNDMMLIFWRKKRSVELPFSSFGDNLINILRKVNRLIYTFKIN